MIKVIVDPGSCHMGKIEYAKELIDLAVENNCWAIKFQLFKHMPPNIELPREWWEELVEYAKDRIEIFASVFDGEALDLLIKHDALYIKFAYTQRFNYMAMAEASKHANVIISCSPMDTIGHYGGFIKLLCIPEYPVTYKIDFSLINKFGFDGFSDHTIGYVQTLEAIENGAEYIEKHITLNYSDINCPDHYFALKPKELKEMMYDIKRNYPER